MPLLISLQACSDDSVIPDVGQGFEAHALHAPWDGLDTDTRFCCHSTAERFFFSFEVADSTMVLTDPFTNEMDVSPEDRVEIFFSPTADLKSGYHCAEIDPHGRTMDYAARYYREMDFGWNFLSLETRAERTPWGYRVGASIARAELESLGLDLEGGFYMGAFQADFKPDGSVVWYSLIPTDDDEADFHKPGVLFNCRMTPKQERRGVVVYPNDITSLGLEEWEKRFRQSGINLIGLHAATVNDPIDTLEAFVRSKTGQAFLGMCKDMGVDVEYELHALQNVLPRELFDEHPEYFRMDPDGQRQQQYNMCFSSEAAVEAMRPQIESMLEWMRPTTHRYFFWTDDKQGRFCNCENCRAYSESEQALMYENRLLALLREYDPEATLAHLAYHQTMEHPVNMRAAEGIFVEFAPISRDYALPLPEASAQVLKDNLLAFPGYSQHILEYWLDESMFSRWKRDSLVQMHFEPWQCARDIEGYRSMGAADITCFATWLYGDYVARYGSTEAIFRGYGESFSESDGR